MSEEKLFCKSYKKGKDGNILYCEERWSKKHKKFIRKWVTATDKLKYTYKKYNDIKFYKEKVWVTRDVSYIFGLFTIPQKIIEEKLIIGKKVDNNHIYKLISYNKFDKEKTKIGINMKEITLVDYLDNWEVKSQSQYYCKDQPNGNIYRSKIVRKWFVYNFVYGGNKIPNIKEWHFTRDQHTRPFVVYIDRPNVYIYQIPKNQNFAWVDVISEVADNIARSYYVKLTKKYKIEKIFIYEDVYFEGFKGASILLKIGKERYVYIGSNIFEFSTPGDEIIKYNAQPTDDLYYGVAIGKKNMYDMVERKYIANKYINDWDDPVQDMWTFKSIKEGDTRIVTRKNKKHIKNIKNILQI